MIRAKGADNMASLGERLHMLRKERGWTLEEVASRIGMQKSNLSKYERGKNENMKQSTIAMLANMFDVSVPYLLGYTDERHPVAELYARLSEENQATIKSMIEFLLDQQRRTR